MWIVAAKRRGYKRKLYEALEDSPKKQGIVNMYACIAHPVVEKEYLIRDSENFHTAAWIYHRWGYFINAPARLATGTT